MPSMPGSFRSSRSTSGRISAASASAVAASPASRSPHPVLDLEQDPQPRLTTGWSSTIRTEMGWSITHLRCRISGPRPLMGPHPHQTCPSYPRMVSTPPPAAATLPQSRPARARSTHVRRESVPVVGDLEHRPARAASAGSLAAAPPRPARAPDAEQLLGHASGSSRSSRERSCSTESSRLRSYSLACVSAIAACAANNARISSPAR